jgi:hypothetical protein
MWISTDMLLPKPGQKVFFTTGHMIYRASFQRWQVRASDDGPLWLSVSGFRVTHWMPAKWWPKGWPSPPLA